MFTFATCLRSWYVMESGEGPDYRCEDLDTEMRDQFCTTLQQTATIDRPRLPFLGDCVDYEVYHPDAVPTSVFTPENGFGKVIVEDNARPGTKDSDNLTLCLNEGSLGSIGAGSLYLISLTTRVVGSSNRKRKRQLQIQWQQAMASSGSRQIVGTS
ncbi:hypothetical protein STEG23_023799, partial [Scotinomys teguina]